MRLGSDAELIQLADEDKAVLLKNMNEKKVNSRGMIYVFLIYFRMRF